MDLFLTNTIFAWSAPVIAFGIAAGLTELVAWIHTKPRRQPRRSTRPEYLGRVFTSTQQLTDAERLKVYTAKRLRVALIQSRKEKP